MSEWRRVARSIQHRHAEQKKDEGERNELPSSVRCSLLAAMRAPEQDETEAVSKTVSCWNAFSDRVCLPFFALVAFRSRLIYIRFD